MLGIIVIGILFILFGVTIFLKPEWLWTFTEKWKSYRADEPSDFYVMSTKFGGILYVIAGVVLIAAPFFLK
jgi:hypothetical protein